MAATYTPTRDEHGRCDGWVAVVNDIDDRKQVEEQLQESARRKDEFLAMLGHELRNPLAAIRNAVATASLDEKNRPAALAIARRQTEQVGHLVDDLLDVGRITQGRINLRREPIAVNITVERAVEASRPSCDERGHTVTLHLPAEDLYVDADASRLEQVLSNLLSNACKYTPPGGKLSVALERRNGVAAVVVRDSGIGIAPELLPHVFELFTQGERSLDRAQGGLGVGLTIARRIVELHGGCITASSDGPGKGSEFVVTLPIVAAPQRANMVSDTVETPARRASRILMVEDNPDAAESLRLLLELLGHEVRVAHNGLDAVAAALTHAPQLMLIDIGLPGIDGYEVARRIRQEPSLRSVTLVALTGYGRQEDKEAALDAGFDYHLVKPVDPENLERLMVRVASRSSGDPKTTLH